MVTREEKKHMEVTRKYSLRLLILKLEVVRLFDEGYSPAEVRYILLDLEIPGLHRSRGNTIRRYYSLWKKAQVPKARRKWSQTTMVLYVTEHPAGGGTLPLVAVDLDAHFGLMCN